MTQQIFSSLTIGLQFSDTKNKEAKRLFSRSSQDFSKSLISRPDRVDSQVDDDLDKFNLLRKQLKIKIKGTDIPNLCVTFDEMPISNIIKSVILNNIENSKWKEPTPVQMQVIPILLNGRDVLATAPTGSGKTAAFVVPALSILENPMKVGVRALLLAPTRELAHQIFQEASRLCYGRRLKIRELKKSTVSKILQQQDKGALSGVDLLIATPMRVLALLRDNLINLQQLKLVIMDEADKLFEQPRAATGGLTLGHSEPRRRSNGSASVRMKVETSTEDDENAGEDDPGKARNNIKSLNNEVSFIEITTKEAPVAEEGGNPGDGFENEFLSQMDQILTACPRQVQRGLFSATSTPFVQQLAEGFLKNPVTVHIGAVNTGASTIDQKLQFVGTEEGKLLALRQLVQAGLQPPVLVFVQSKERARALFKEIALDGLNADVIHAERTQQQREQVIQRFREGKIWVLICTDLMARGIDFLGVRMVINYDFPQTAISYIHRIGRTGRAGRKGVAVTFFTEEDLERLRSIANVIKLSGCDVPDWMLHIKPMTTKERRQLRVVPPKRRTIEETSAYDRRKNAHKKLMITQSRTKKRVREEGADDKDPDHGSGNEQLHGADLGAVDSSQMLDPGARILQKKARKVKLVG